MKFDVNKQYNELCQLIDIHEVISFDIYDTALLRNVLYPTDIFDIICQELKKENIVIKDFKGLRIKAEKKVRAHSKFEDITLEDIYQAISDKIGERLSYKIKNIELSIEEKFTISNPFIKKVYDYARSCNKKIIFISDMYLPKEFISKLLIKNGFNKYDGLFISGSIGVSKASKKLFHHIRNEMNIYNNSWLHIGDNSISDYENAIKCNIDAYYYKDTRKRVDIKKNYSIEYSIMKAIQINYCETTGEINYWQRFGIYIVSSLFFGFTLWLTNKLKGEDNVYFLSRDGYLPYKLYKKFSQYIENLPEARYLYASRRAYQIPNIFNMNESDALDLLTAYNSNLGQKINLGEIFENIGLDKKKYLEVIKVFGFSSYEDIIKSDKDRTRAKEVLRVIYSDIIKILTKEKLLLEEYLKQNKIYEFKELNIVDIGWRGSTHKAIQDITNIPTNGYYFGTAYNVYDDIREKVHGYAFNLGKPYKNMKKIMDNVMMYELIFSAPHGTLIGLKKRNKKIYPILKEVENNNYLYESLEYMNSSVLEITDQYLKYYEYLKDISYKDCLSDYFEFIDAKKYEDLVEFSKLTGVVGIGDSKDIQRYVTTTSIEEYYKNKKRIQQEISKNLWKNALIIKGSISELKRKNLFFNFGFIKFNNWITKEKILKALRNPKKAIKFIKRKIELLIK